MSDNSANKATTAAASRRILVIEDNFDSAEVLQTFLEINGHRITVKMNGSDGIEEAARAMPDIIICDISLSGDLNGYDVAAEIRRRSELKSIFLIALSGFGQPEDIKKSKFAGFDEHLTKPTDFDALIELINNFDER
jgi:CheY-like chemotaxis protein